MLKLFKKDLILFFNDQRSFILTFIIPVVLITLFAFAYGGIEYYASEARSLKLLIVDTDKTELSEKLITELKTIEGLEVLPADLGLARKLIRDGDYAGALILNTGFSDSINQGRSMPVELIYDKEQDHEIGMIQSILINNLVSFNGKIQLGRFIELSGSLPEELTYEAAIDKMGVGNLNSFSLKMTSVVGEKSGTNLGLIQAVAGTAILMLLFSVAGVGTSILEEKENGTINRLLYSPLKSRTILYSKMIFAFFIAILQLCVMFLYSWVFLHLDITINLPALILMIISTAFAISSIGIFLASLAKSRQQALSLSTLIILVMSAIGGSMIPLFIMPEIMTRVAVLSVNYWGIQGFYDIFWRQLPLSEIMPRILILISTGIVLTTISVRLINRNILRLR